MTTLIVGCGYLGRRVGRDLIARGERVLGTVRSESSASRLRAWGIEPVITDVTVPATLDALPKAERVFYCVGFDRSAGVPMRSVYVDGLKSVLDRLDGRPGRFVFASSTGVYGQDDGSWVDEDSPTEPRSESGRICLEAEDLVRSYSEANDWSSVVLRFAGLYGPGRIVRRAAIERGEPIAGDPDRALNLIHIDDAASGAVAALSGRSEALRPLYTLADDRPVSRLEYYGLVARELGVAGPRFVRPPEGSPEARRDEADKKVANRRMKADLVRSLRYPDIRSGVPAALAQEDRP